MDLNLLVTLDALLQENSVVGAAERLFLTPPAVSRALARIRDLTGDDILVRSGRAMTPTPYALSIRAEVHELVRQGKRLLKPGRELDLPNLQVDYAIRSHDALTAALAPRLIATVAHSAPLVRLRFLGETQEDFPALARGQVDLELGATRPTAPDISHTILAEDSLVLAMRKGHPLERGPLGLKRFAAALHVNVTRRGRLHGAIDDLLAGQGLQRRVVATLPTTANALEVVACSDAVAIVPEASSKALRHALKLAARRIPQALPASEVVMSWHRRHDNDPAHGWLRACVVEAAGGLDWVDKRSS